MTVIFRLAFCVFIWLLLGALAVIGAPLWLLAPDGLHQRADR